VAKFKYLEMTVTNQSDIYDEIRNRLNPENGSLQNLLASYIKI